MKRTIFWIKSVSYIVHAEHYFIAKTFSVDWSNLKYKLSDQQNIMANFNPIILRGFLVQGFYNNMVWKINLLAEDMPNRDYKNYYVGS